MRIGVCNWIDETNCRFACIEPGVVEDSQDGTERRRGRRSSRYQPKTSEYCDNVIEAVGADVREASYHLAVVVLMCPVWRRVFAVKGLYGIGLVAWHSKDVAESAAR